MRPCGAGDEGIMYAGFGLFNNAIPRQQDPAGFVL
jgi:hypothetical protein